MIRYIYPVPKSGRKVLVMITLVHEERRSRTTLQCACNVNGHQAFKSSRKKHDYVAREKVGFPKQEEG